MYYPLHCMLQQPYQCGIRSMLTHNSWPCTLARFRMLPFFRRPITDRNTVAPEMVHLYIVSLHCQAFGTRYLLACDLRTILGRKKGCSRIVAELRKAVEASGLLKADSEDMTHLVSCLTACLHFFCFLLVGSKGSSEGLRFLFLTWSALLSSSSVLLVLSSTTKPRILSIATVTISVRGWEGKAKGRRHQEHRPAEEAVPKDRGRSFPSDVSSPFAKKQLTPCLFLRFQISNFEHRMSGRRILTSRRHNANPRRHQSPSRAG